MDEVVCRYASHEIQRQWCAVDGIVELDFDVVVPRSEVFDREVLVHPDLDLLSCEPAEPWSPHDCVDPRVPDVTDDPFVGILGLVLHEHDSGVGHVHRQPLAIRPQLPLTRGQEGVGEVVIILDCADPLRHFADVNRLDATPVDVAQRDRSVPVQPG